jgi:hypothetical protein
MSVCVVTDSATRRPLTASERFGHRRGVSDSRARGLDQVHVDSHPEQLVVQSPPTVSASSFALRALQTGVASATEQCD